MKKTYIKPDMTVVEMKAKTQILAGSAGNVGTTGVEMYWEDTANENEFGL